MKGYFAWNVLNMLGQPADPAARWLYATAAYTAKPAITGWPGTALWQQPAKDAAPV
ncbi:hypothetical protein MELB17_18604 [Marinobacter sp. ELB17]|nr:hypothetical protein MELB17_18604 [Marinobacter sp. ELB17]